MKRRTRLEKARFHPADLDTPAIVPLKQWVSGNQGLYDRFRAWLRAGGYGDSALDLYSVAARLALGLLNKPYWQIDPSTDWQQVDDYLNRTYDSQATRATYRKGLRKLAEFLALTGPTARPQQSLNWAYYAAALPAWLIVELRAYLTLRQRNWLPAQRHRASLDLLSHTTLFLRWLHRHTPLTHPAQITPERWFDYVDTRLAAGISPTTLNGELSAGQAFVQYLTDQQRPVCARLLRVQPLKENQPLPKDVPVAQLQLLIAEIEQDAASPHAGSRRMGLMDRAWFLLMLYSGLRTGEVRRLGRSDLDLEARRLRLEQAKGLKDRMVYVSQTTAQALQTYLTVRGPANTDHVFLYRHQPLSVSYCLERLHTYGHRCGLQVTPHQLRHSCATLLLNAGAPVLTVQTLLGHKFIDTTLRYARLYDGTIAADYYRAMRQIEPRLTLAEPASGPPPPGHLLALVDSLAGGTLNDQQRETVHLLREGLVAMLEAGI